MTTSETRVTGRLAGRLIPLAALLSLPPAVSCLAPPPATGGPLLAVELEHFPGTVFTGPVAAGAEPTWREGGDPWAVWFRIDYLEAAPNGESRSVSELARQVFVDKSDEPLRATGALTTEVAAFVGQAGIVDAGADWEVRECGVLWSGTSTAFRSRRRPDLEGGPRWETFDLELSREPGAQAAELALVVEGWVQPRRDDEAPLLETEEAPADPDPIRERHHVLLDLQLAPGSEPSAFFVPLPLSETPDGGLLFFVEVAGVGELTTVETELAEAVALARAQLDETLEETYSRVARLTPAESFRFETDAALEALGLEGLERTTLVFLADATDAELARDIALVANDEELAAAVSFVRDRLRENQQGDGAVNDARSFGWLLEQAGYRWLARRAEESEDGLAPELSSILMRHTGAMGRFPDLVLALVLECKGPEQLERRLVSENRILLEDTHPAVRVRALDWLTARDEAPEGFDPLAPRETRRAVLAAYEAREEAPPGAEESAMTVEDDQ